MREGIEGPWNRRTAYKITDMLNSNRSVKKEKKKKHTKNLDLGSKTEPG